MASTPDAHQMRGGGSPGDTMLEGATPPPLSATNTHQLDFYQAMVDFKVMFPNMDEEIIEAVLRANNGAVDATIDQLLTMNVDTTPADTNPHPPATVTMEPPGYATVTKTTPASVSRWSAQKPVLAESTSSDDDDPPPYPPYQHQSDDVHDYANTDLGAAAIHTNSAFYDIEPAYTKPKSLESTTVAGNPAAAAAAALPTLPATTAMASSSPAPVNEQPTDNALNVLSASCVGGGASGDFFTPAPVFDPFDDPFFKTPAAPKPQPPAHIARDPSPLTEVSTFGVTPFITRESPKKKLYKPRWNPPLLGDLPEDFLRITTFETPVKKVSSSSSSSSQGLGSVSISSSSSSSGSGSRHHHHHSPRSGGSQGDDVARSSVMSMSGSQQRSGKHRHSGEHSPSHHHSPSATLNSDMIAARIAENSRQRSEVKANTDKAQMLDDEMFALYLQNEEFLNDLREDEDFMRTLERERMNATAFEPSDDPDLDVNRPQRGQLEGYGEDGLGALGAFPYDKDVPAGEGDQNAELRAQLKHMGGSSKKKLATLARRFFSRTKKKKSSKQMLKDSPLGPSKHNLLDEEDAPEPCAMSSLREDSESNLERRRVQGASRLQAGGEGGVSVVAAEEGIDEEQLGSYLTVQRPPYHPDCVTTYHRTDPASRC